MNSSEKVMIFIDGSNFYHILKDYFKKGKTLMDFNFEKFVHNLINGRKLVRTYYYSAPLDKTKDEETYAKQQKFFEKLKKLPDFELMLCRMQKGFINNQKIYQVKEDDIHIAVDMVKFAYNDAYDTAILISTDGDFVPAIEAVKEKGKRVENVGFKPKFSWHLKQKSDRFVQFDKNSLNEFF
ncbi:MAG TPA: NYN domain-containing protein [Candidatus Nanoarchaeia archaeon]|nr:NYN domain-containing protein [Candidatus Pacearchaeota archaeon]HLC74181.1 NYN domain-containing protein [Candidatus Nanoarchaeia archaeon]